MKVTLKILLIFTILIFGTGKLYAEYSTNSFQDEEEILKIIDSYNNDNFLNTKVQKQTLKKGKKRIKRSLGSQCNKY